MDAMGIAWIELGIGIALGFMLGAALILWKSPLLVCCATCGRFVESSVEEESR